MDAAVTRVLARRGKVALASGAADAPHRARGEPEWVTRDSRLRALRAGSPPRRRRSATWGRLAQC
jgi:hypothetical protein